MSSNAFLNALQAMELSQMCVQGTWNSDSPLKQIPNFTGEVIKRCAAAKVESVYDVMELEDDQRNSLLQMDARQMRDVAKFCNAYPSIELAHALETPDELSAGSPITMNVTLEREVDEEDEAAGQIVPAPFFPGKKIENWWLVVGEPSTKQCVPFSPVTLADARQAALDQKDYCAEASGGQA